MNRTPWLDIEPQTAEKSVRYLRGAIADTESEIGAYSKLGNIDALPFGMKLGLSSLELRRQGLEDELRILLSHRESELIQLALDGPDFPRHTATFGSLASILRSTQGLFTSVVQAITTGPTSRGRVPIHVAQLSQLNLVTTFPSSFGLLIEGRTNGDAKAQATLERSLSGLFSLLQNAQNQDHLLENASVLGPRVIGHLQSLVYRLHGSRTVIKLAWSDSAGSSRDWIASEETISSVAVSLSAIREPQVITLDVSGILLGLSLLKGTFEILSDRGDLIEGTVTEDILDIARASFGTRKRFIYRETSTKNQLTGNTRSASVLTKILEPNEVLGEQGLALYQ